MFGLEGNNFIGDAAITAEQARERAFKSKIPFIEELQRTIMQKVIEAYSDGKYEVSLTYKNKDPYIDDLICDWLEELHYTDIDIVDISDDEDDETEDDTALSFSFSEYEDESEEEENNDNKEEDPDEPKENNEEKPQVDSEMQKMYDSIIKDEKQKEDAEITKKFFTTSAKVEEIKEDEKLEEYKTFPREKKEN